MPVDSHTLSELQKLFKIPRLLPQAKGKKVSSESPNSPALDKLDKSPEERPKLLQVDFTNLSQLFEGGEESYASYMTPLYTPLKDRARQELLIKRRPDNITKILIDHKIRKLQETLLLKGTLKSTQDGFIYLKVSDEFLKILTPSFQLEGGRIPPFFEDYFHPGAHIGVITQEEAFKHALNGKIKELGEEISFTIQGCSKIELSTASPFEALWVLHIASSSLEHLRERYHLPKWCLSRGFLMIVAVKNRADFGRHSLKEDVQYTINPCTFAV